MSRPDWNARFSESEFAYGTEPNSFLAENANLLTTPVLSIGEGEGRNAVFMATQGLKVHAVDGSSVGLGKAERLAASHGVTFSTEVADLKDFEPQPTTYGGVVSIYAHLPSVVRGKLYPLLVQTLKPGGILILESYSEDQLNRSTGGPRELDRLLTCDKIESELVGLETVLLQEIDREVVEGKFHTGMASVIQFIGRKPV
ncbi:class I SAM-dependent methyltransferase [Thalassoglobus sp. JC818]|uniref:class I SAM-dependent methyltransferase n=1 Tax=Thalassoglobus sp. JC818 TaxID=3232136 RepID=UPI0034597024